MRSVMFVALLALTPAAQASDVAKPAAAASANAAPENDKLICRREQVSGSNIPGKRICKYKRDIDMERLAAREAAKDMATPQGGSGSSGN